MRSKIHIVTAAGLLTCGLVPLGARAATLAGVSVSGEPTANLIALNNFAATSRSSWALTSATNSTAELGQTFSVSSDVSLGAVAFQLSDLFSVDTNEGPVRNANSQAFSLVIDVMNATIDAADVAPASQLATYTGLTPADFNDAAPDTWVTLTLDSSRSLTAGVQYGFRLVWTTPVDDRLISIKHTGSTDTTNPYTAGLAYRFSESTATYAAIGTLGHSRDLNFALIAVPEPASLGLLAIGTLVVFVRQRGRAARP